MAAQVHVELPVGEAGREPVGDVHRERRLARSRHTVDGDDRRRFRAVRVLDDRQLVLAAGQRREAGGQLAGGRSG
ncbi:hypothetical protein GCM10020001_102570 [Nonomuraea salmonea]